MLKIKVLDIVNKFVHHIPVVSLSGEPRDQLHKPNIRRNN